MALINCPECGKEISDKAASCPNCGCPIANDQQENFDSDGKNDMYLGIISVILSIIGMIIAFAINDGILLIIPFALLIISVVLGIKCNRKFSIVGILISGIGIVLIIFEILKFFI